MWQTILQQFWTRIVIPTLLKLLTAEMFVTVFSEIGWAAARATKFTQIDDNIMIEIDKHLKRERK